MERYGSLEYRLRSNSWTLLSGLRIYARRGLAPRTSDKGFSGWPTPTALASRDGALVKNPETALRRMERGQSINLDDSVQLVGWHTPRARGDAAGTRAIRDGLSRNLEDQIRLIVKGWPTPDAAAFNLTADPEKNQQRRDLLSEKYGNNGAGLSLAQAAKGALWSPLRGWATPTAADAAAPAKTQRPSRVASGRKSEYLNRQVLGVAGWATPTAVDGSRGSLPPRPHDKGHPLSQQVVMVAGWATPLSLDAKDGAYIPSPATPVNAILGRQACLCLAENPTEVSSPAALHPEFSRWLMGYPIEWRNCAPSAMQSSRS